MGGDLLVILVSSVYESVAKFLLLENPPLMEVFRKFVKIPDATTCPKTWISNGAIFPDFRLVGGKLFGSPIFRRVRVVFCPSYRNVVGYVQILRGRVIVLGVFRTTAGAERFYRMGAYLNLI